MIRKPEARTRRTGSPKARAATPAQIVRDIRKRYGDVIDLKATPALMIEILNRFGTVAGVDGTGGVSPGTSTVAVGITPPSKLSDLAEIQEILKAVLKLQKQVSVMHKQVNQLAPAR